MNYKLWATCNDLNTVAMNQTATLDAFSYIMDGMDKAAAEASRGGQEAAAAYLSQYTNFSRMLLLISSANALLPFKRSFLLHINSVFPIWTNRFSRQSNRPEAHARISQF